jgi:DNA-binding transcriptional ArsR family regulator
MTKRHSSVKLRDVRDVLHALADENRLRALAALRRGELCVCQLIALLDLAPSTVSKHLSILRSARLVDGRKDGRWMYYRLSRDHRTPNSGKVRSCLFRDLERTGCIAKDRVRLQAIRNEKMDSLCRRLFGKPCQGRP